MLVIPAIDLMNGKVVRLLRGDPRFATFYDSLGTPIDVAKKWKKEGAKQIHIIDLDAAFGKPDNLGVALGISKATELPIQLGGGIRNVETVEKILNSGIRYVILGSLAFRDPTIIELIQKKLGLDSIIVALDNKDGIVMVEGWTSSTSFTLMDALARFGKLGVKRFLITSITNDGTLSGPDLKTLEKSIRFSSAEIIAAGGIGTLKDLIALKRIGVKAAVVGKALYEGKFALREAIDVVGEN